MSGIIISLLTIMDKPMQSLLKLPTSSLTDLQLSEVCIYQNQQYRQGEEVISDDEFELVYIKALRERLPEHPLLVQPQSTLVSDTGLIPHNKPMLSTDKAYTIEDIEKYVALCEKHAALNNIDIATLMYRITPKLDGIAGDYRKREHLLLTRGEDGFGQDFSMLLDKGLQIIGDSDEDNLTGEAVVLREYFDQHILGKYKNPRNFMGGVVNRIILSQNTNKITDLALEAKAIHFVVFDSVEGITVDRDSLIHSLEHIAQDMKDSSPYLTDGTVIEVVNSKLKEKMGHNGSFHLWQIAKKKIGEIATSPIIDIAWTVGRTSQVTPSANIEPRELSGVTVSNVLLHHAGRVREGQLGNGAVISLTRAGEVVPYYLKTLEGVTPTIPTHCPCCETVLEWQGDILYCRSISCSAAVANNLIHHFRCIGVKGWADKTMTRLVEANYDTIEKLYAITQEQLTSIGIGEGTAKNLLKERNRGLIDELKDSNLLASLGISNLGRGTSKKILAVHLIDTIHTLEATDLLALDDFGEITSNGITKGIQDKKATLAFLLEQGFNLKHTQNIKVESNGSLKGMTVVFSGTMKADRKEMERIAIEEKGAKKTSSSVNSKTDLLVTGLDVGKKKLEGAIKHNVLTINEDDYLANY